MRAEEIVKEFARTTDEVLSLDRFKAKLETGRPLRIKYGVDVTAAFLHIGHAVNLWMMRELQELGHKVVFLIGDFTTRIGDPTGRSATRPVLSFAEIEANAQEFLRQVSLVLRTDEAVFEVRRNSEWFDRMPCGEFLNLLAMVTHGRLISRDMFQKRLEASTEIYMHEMIYPLLQGYDSVELKSDLTIIGSDQLFNEMMGCFYQEKFGQAPQVVITTKITPGLDGKQKQSKSLGNYIALGHSPRDKFGRVMTLPDELVGRYFEIYTKVPVEEITDLVNGTQVNPFENKKRLAYEIVARYHGVEVAAEELAWFVSVFSHREIPTDLTEIVVGNGPHQAFELARACFPVTAMSNAQLRRLFEQGAVTTSERKLGLHDTVDLSNSIVLKVGKRSWFRVKESE